MEIIRSYRVTRKCREILHNHFARKHICRVMEESDQDFSSNVQQLQQDFHESTRKMVVEELVHLASVLQSKICE